MTVASEHFEHAADVGVRGFGDTPGEAFAGAARALFELVSEDLTAVEARHVEALTCEAPDLEALLVAFLNELIFLMAARKLVFSRFQVEIEAAGAEPHLRAWAFGEPFDRERHAYTVEPKGATFTALRVAREEGRWLAQCIVDV